MKALLCLKFNNERTQLDSTAAWTDVAAGGAGRADHATTWACSKQAPNLQSDCGQTIIILQRHGEIKTTWMFLKDSPPTTFRIVFIHHCLIWKTCESFASLHFASSLLVSPIVKRRSKRDVTLGGGAWPFVALFARRLTSSSEAEPQLPLLCEEWGDSGGKRLDPRG